MLHNPQKFAEFLRHLRTRLVIGDYQTACDLLKEALGTELPGLEMSAADRWNRQQDQKRAELRKQGFGTGGMF